MPAEIIFSMLLPTSVSTALDLNLYMTPFPLFPVMPVSLGGNLLSQPVISY